ncbi:hypothetical protein [Streptomyces dysideae]|uniref:hypothetical protein n=1 Tax=Streptomyces dysideae TaxID=909626 RepID=UPI00131C3EFD|nr:hypothetical protein [Streptomyces dysideae]
MLQPEVAAAEPGAGARSAIVEGKDPTPSGQSLTQLDDFFDTPIGRMLYVGREARRLDDKPWRNMAIGFVDITDLQGLDTAGYEIVDVDELSKTNPALYEQLGLVDRPQIRKFAVIPQSNDASSDVPANHSEMLMLIRELRYLGVENPDRVFAVGTDRSPCPTCAPRIPKGADVFYLVKDGKGSSSELRERIQAAKPATEKNEEYKKELAQERKRIAERKVANPKRRARLAKQTKNVFQTGVEGGGSCQLGLGLGPASPGTEQAASASLSGGRGQQAAFTVRSGAVQADCHDGGAAKAGGAAGIPESGLVKALSEPFAQAPGGIDFSSLQLRYLSDPGDGSGLQYSFQAPTSTTGGTSPVTGVNAAGLTSDAFFVWLALDPSTFWVNLNPTEPDRIVDADMGRTDVGRIMLQADLRLKKDVGRLIHPGTALGKEYHARRKGTCMTSRVWIVPEPADVRRDGDKLYILKAPLKVRMESEYIDLPAGQGAAGDCPQEDQATRAHNEALFRSLVLPKLTKLVNTGSYYAELRRVYLARVAAQWYRDLSAARQTTYGDLIDKGDINSWITRTSWKPTDTFDQYVRSYTRGDYRFTRKVTKGNYIYTYTYVYGGVDLTSVPLRQISDSSFDARYSGLTKDIDASLTKPTGGDGSGALWLGAPTPRQAAAGFDAADDGSGLSVRDVLAPRVLLPVMLVALAAVLLWRRSRRLSAAGTASPLRRTAVRRERKP